MSKTLAELYRSFSRAAALVPTAEANICCEELCSRILSVGRDWKNKVGRLEYIIKYKNSPYSIQITIRRNNEYKLM